MPIYVSSTRVRSLSPSFISGLAERVAAMGSAGIDVICLHEGELDADPSDAVIASTIRALEDRKTRYSQLAGEPQLIAAIRAKLRTDNEMDVEAENILVANGSTQVLFQLFQALLDPGDEAIVPIPCWPTYLAAVRIAGGVPMPPAHGWRHLLEQSREAPCSDSQTFKEAS